MAKREDIPLETFSKVVEAVYDCALDPNLWHETVGLIAALCRCQHGALGVVDLDNVCNEMTFHVGLDDHTVRLYAEKYGAMNPHNVPLQLIPVGVVATTAELVDEREFLECRFYKEYWKPLGFRRSIGFNVLKTGRRFGAMAVTRTENQGSFENADVHLLTLLAPHVCRSVAISDALNLKTVKSEILEATLDTLASGVFMTDRRGRIVYMNRAAERQVKISNALGIVNSCLAAVDRTAQGTLAKAIAEATANETETPTGGITIALPAGENVGLVATVLPLNRGERQHLGGNFAATAAIFVQDPVVVPPLPGEAFAKLYGLTGSELRVLLAMAPGLSVKQAAEVLGIGDTTAKTHLQSIYAKTGTSKQTKLMHLFMSSAPPVQATPTR